MKKLIIKLLKLVLGEWSIFAIYSKQLQAPTFSSEAPFNYTTEHLNEEHYRFRAFQEDTLLCTLDILWGEAYKKRGFINLKNNEAKVISVETAPNFRGKGHAVRLLSYAESIIYEKEIRCLYARIWHSNKSSISAFRKSNWTKHGSKVSLKLFNLLPIRFYIKS